MLAFLALCLEEVSNSVDQTCHAWEKRDYWVKADRFRLDWAWAQSVYSKLVQRLREDDIDGGVIAATSLGSHLVDVSLPRRSSAGAPWNDAWASWHQSQGLGDEVFDQS